MDKNFEDVHQQVATFVCQLFSEQVVPIGFNRACEKVTAAEVAAFKT